MDAVTRTRVLALIRHLRTRRQAGLEISSSELSRRFRLDAFIVERLIEQELGHPDDMTRLSDPSTDDAEPHRPTREMSPPIGTGLD